MNSELRIIYDQYVAYYREFREDFDQHVGRNIPERFRSPLLSFEEFAATWQRWGQQCVQDSWRERFEQGYARQADEFTERIKTVLMRVDDGSSSVSLTDAA